MGVMLANSLSYTRRNLFRRGIPFGVACILSILTWIVVYFLIPKSPDVVVLDSKTRDCANKLDELHLTDYKLTRPLLFADLPSENAELIPLKEKIIQLISQAKPVVQSSGFAVYFKRMDDGAWFAINSSKKFNKSNFLKVPLLITILKQAMTNPGLLDRKIFFEKHFKDAVSRNKEFKLKENTSYTVKELLSVMIVQSDNDAKYLLMQMADKRIYRKLFSDLDISPPELTGDHDEYQISITDYCKFFTLLYNSGYIKDEYSDLALSLLSQSAPHTGLVKNFNPGVPVVHKFSLNSKGGMQQVHDVGIFYVEQKPYLLAVMAEGSDSAQLSDMLSRISELVYHSTSAGI